MARGRPTKYLHLLRAMRAGDSIYLEATASRFDRQLASAVFRYGGKCSCTNLIAVRLDRVTALHVVQITILQPLKE